MQSLLQVEGMTCQNCVRHVREALEAVEGVRDARVNLDAQTAVVRWIDSAADDARLIRAVTEAGYAAAARGGEAPRADHDHAGSAWRFNVIVGLLITVPLIFGEWVFALHHTRWFAWLSFLLVLPVQFLCGWRFYAGAWRQLKMGQSNMDTLVALGSTTAFFYSVYGLFAPHHAAHLYFAESAAIITLISLGHYLEARTSERAAGAVRALLDLAPQTARRITAEGREENVAVADLVKGDRVAIAPGDRVPTDGTVVTGTSAVNESMLTGESIPVQKSAGARLYGGTMNHDGQLVMKIDATGEETALAQIVAVVERAQNSRAEVQHLADRVSSIFVPIVVAIAVATLVGWGLFSVRGWEAGIINAVAVLIVACPCAMGLATPAAIMAGANAAARRGILIRDGSALEKSGRITAVVFDKTGTLTVGSPHVESERALRGDPALLRSIALSLAQPSRHPLSQTIARYYEVGATATLLESWSEESGSGVVADYQGSRVRLGSLRWLAEQGVHFDSATAAGDGTLVGVARNAELLGVIVLTDAPKPNAARVVAQLQEDGLEVFVLSGDRRSAVEATARSVGIPAGNVFAEVRPAEKAAALQELQARNQRVAFVGDGINDAPALAQADLGIAVTRASDVAREAADILLLKSDIEAVPEALGLAVATLRTIKQNLFWAFFYNAAAVPLAAAGYISPILCAAAMALSDLFVLGNALRLYRWKPN